MTNETTKRIAKTALMIALIFVCTFTIKLPNPATGGYTHMGDCMAFLAVLVLGKKDGALAAGLGAALSDLLTGAMIWVLPTFIFKFIMGYIMGVVLEKGNNESAHTAQTVSDVCNSTTHRNLLNRVRYQILIITSSIRTLFLNERINSW